MANDFKSRYRVDEVPWYWWLPMQLYGCLAGFAVFLYYGLVFLTSRIQRIDRPPQDQNYVYCFWHQQVFTYQSLQLRYRRFSMFAHPLWYMYPLHVACLLYTSDAADD